MFAIEDIRPDGDGEILRSSFPDIDQSERPWTQVSYGLTFDKAVKKHVFGSLNAHRVYIIGSKGVENSTGAAARLAKALGERHVGTWLGIQPHTPYDGVIPIIQDVRKKGADCIVTLGGGSLADGAKLIVYAVENDVETVDDLVAMEEPFRDHVPEAKRGIGNPAQISIIFVPTTLAGAEYSKYAGCTNPKNHMKVQFTHPTMFAKLIVLDGALCKSTPDWVWRSTGCRTIDHCVENICSSNPRPESDAACERALKMIVKALLSYIADPENLEARLQAQIATNYAMTGLTLEVMCGASHGIGHNLGPLGVGHGETSCILLPAVMKYNAKANQKQQDKVLEVFWGDSQIREVLEKRGLERDQNDAGDVLRAIFDELDMPKTLNEKGIGEDKWDDLARNSLADFFVKSNPVPIEKPEQIKDILRLVA